MSATAADTTAVPLEWEHTDCPLCGGPRQAPVLQAADPTSEGGPSFAVVRCPDCGLCFTNPRPTPASIGRFYPNSYRPHTLPRWKRRRPTPRGRPGKERQTLPWVGQGRLLDFGCGGGSYLERMHRQGWHVTGLDASPRAVQRVRAELGLPAFVGSLPHPDLAPESFDVITMWHSLEHVHAPREVLGEARRLLAPGGRLLVAVPNIDSLPFRLFGPAWFALDLPRHLTHFSPATLRRMVEAAGFTAGPVRMVRHSDWFRSSARRSRAARWHRWLTVRPVARLATWYSYLTRQTDCILLSADV
jgi:SAM-dependent methyltransferase